MKKLILTLSLITATLAQAKVSDFNNLINENSKAQNELHQNLKQDLNTTRIAYEKEKTTNFIVDHEVNSINVPTSKLAYGLFSLVYLRL